MQGKQQTKQNDKTKMDETREMNNKKDKRKINIKLE